MAEAEDGRQEPVALRSPLHLGQDHRLDCGRAELPPEAVRPEPVVPPGLLGVEPGDDLAGVVADLEFLADVHPGPTVQDLPRPRADLDGDLDAPIADVIPERLALLGG